MKKLLRPSDRLLFVLGFLGDLFEEVSDPLGIMTASYRQVYGWVPPKYRRHNFRQVVLRLFKTGYLERVVKNGELYLRLTSVGKKKLIRDFPLRRFQRQRWDGKWRIVIFDIEERVRTKRNQLRAKLSKLGFGMIQESVWITPLDIGEDLREFLEAVGLKNETFVLTAHQDLGKDKREVAAKIWQLEEINKAYQEVINLWEEKQKKRQLLTEGDKQRLKDKYLEALVSDPYLPGELLPQDWVGEKARKIIKNL